VTPQPNSHQQIGHPYKKYSKEIAIFNDAIEQMDSKDTYRIFCPSTTESSFFSEAY
jgi:hypothetical protein